MAHLALAATVIGTVASTAATLMQGGAKAAEGEYAKKQFDIQAAESRAAGQRESFEQRRKGAFLQSKLQARAAASGGGATDPTIIQLGEGIAGRTEYEALTDLFRGENRARGLEDKGTAAEISGKAAQTGSYFAAAGQAMKGFAGWKPGTFMTAEAQADPWSEFRDEWGTEGWG